MHRFSITANTFVKFGSSVESDHRKSIKLYFFQTWVRKNVFLLTIKYNDLTNSVKQGLLITFSSETCTKLTFFYDF